MAASEFWKGWLEEQPQNLYGALLGTKGSTNFLDYWRSQYGNVYNRYLGALGTQALGGQEPTLSFYDYLTQNPFQQQWGKLAPWTRGQRPTPSMRWMIPR